MSPVSHAFMGWLIAQPLAQREQRALATAAALIPDIDGVGLLFGTELYLRWHHTFGHNIFIAAGVAIAGAAAGRSLMTGLVCLVAFASHILFDIFGSGIEWGIPIFWPISHLEYSFAPPFQWELFSWQNFSITALLVVGMIFVARRKQRTIAEVFSEKLDRDVLEVFRKWFRARRKLP